MKGEDCGKNLCAEEAVGQRKVRAVLSTLVELGKTIGGGEVWHGDFPNEKRLRFKVTLNKVTLTGTGREI